MRAAAILTSLALVGCGTVTQTSGVQPLGPDTFTVSSDAINPSTARRSALEQASAHCAGVGRELLVTNIAGTQAEYSRVLYAVTFRCLSKGDPELARPQYRQPADVVIEDSRRP